MTVVEGLNPESRAIGKHSKYYANVSVLKEKLVTVVEGDQKAPFSIATTQRCREGITPFPGLLHFTLDT